MDYNSTDNQRIKEKFVSREVYHCQSYLIDEILKKQDILSFEDIENLYYDTCPHCGEEITEEEKEDIEEKEHCPHCKEEIILTSDLESEPHEIMEWWLVSNYLYEKLRDKGYPVLTDGQCYWWGRCTSGQAILLDGVISEICKEIEILKGHKYSWDKSND